MIIINIWLITRSSSIIIKLSQIITRSEIKKNPFFKEKNKKKTVGLY